MKRTITCLFILTAGLSTACALQTTDDSERVSTRRDALLGLDSFLYLRCNATGWGVDDTTRLQPTNDPDVFTITYEVTQPWMLTGFDHCVFTETNALNAWGTWQKYYGRAESGILQVPSTGTAGDDLVLDAGYVDFRYPELGEYTLAVNWRESTFEVGPAVHSWLPESDGQPSTIALGYGIGEDAIPYGWEGITFVGMTNGEVYFSVDANEPSPHWSRKDQWTTQGGLQQMFGGMVTAIAMNPLNFREAIVARAGTTNGTKVFHTAMGYTWTHLPNVPVEPLGLSYNPVDTSIIYAVGKDGHAVSNDYGTTWSASLADDPLQPPTAVGDVTCATIVNNDPNHIWVGTSAGEVFSTQDRGVSWFENTGGRARPPARAITRITPTVAPTYPPIVTVTLAGLGTGTGADSIWATGNGGESWGNLHRAALPAVPSGTATSLTNLSIDPNDGSVMIVGYTYDAAYRSTDRGQSWALLP